MGKAVCRQALSSFFIFSAAGSKYLLIETYKNHGKFIQHRMRKLTKLLTIVVIIIVMLLIFVLSSPKTNTKLRIYNADDDAHYIAVEIFDLKNKSVFNESFFLNPGERYKSTAPIIKKSGEYMVKVIVDNNTTKRQSVKVSYSVTAIGVDIQKWGAGCKILIGTYVT